MTSWSRSAWLLVLLVAAVIAAACGGGGETSSESGAGSTDTADASDTADAPEAGDPIRLVTFNAGLARGFVDLAGERVDPVVAAVADLDADVVAVQEVWEPGDVRQLQSAASDAGFDHAEFLDPSPETSGEPACHGDELDDIEACVRANCADVPTDQLADCVLSNCGAEYGELCESCQSCLAANVGQPLEAVLESCTAGAAAYAYGGAFGVGLLSRLPVEESDHVVLDSSLNRRAVQYARIDAGPLGDLHVFSTHLSAVFADIPYPGDGSWEAEQARQIRRLLRLVDEAVPAGDPVVVMGDLNTGPPAGDMPGEVAENYQVLADAGFESPYLDDDPACTYCADNPLVGGADDDASVVIDHVLVRDLDGSVSVERVLDDEITVDRGGDEVRTRLSDHYGVALTITPP
jgi:endonuclease/exonuclease/phosphatase family metal-dependent hydrolase